MHFQQAQRRQEDWVALLDEVLRNSRPAYQYWASCGVGLFCQSIKDVPNRV